MIQALWGCQLDGGARFVVHLRWLCSTSGTFANYFDRLPRLIRDNFIGFITFSPHPSRLNHANRALDISESFQGKFERTLRATLI